MKICISSGHGLKIRGASGSPVPPYLDEVDEARKVVETTATQLRKMGVETLTYHDDKSTNQSDNLNAIVNWHNAQGPHDLDVSVHFNAYQQTSKPMGCEVLYKTQGDLAQRTVDAVCTAVPLINRGAKYRSDLKFLNATDEKAVLVEVCFVDSTADANIYRAQYADICFALAEGLSGLQAGHEPAPLERPEVPMPPEQPSPPSGHPTIGKGDTGPAVMELQTKLGVLIPDGDFGNITETWVKAFQGASGLTADGVVGPATWEEVDALAQRKFGELPLPKELADQIYTMAQESEIADYSWPDRGVPPQGYIPGMALSFGYAAQQWLDEDATAIVMAKAEGNADKDALAWYHNEFAALGMSNRREGIETLRHLFVMMIGLGPRESSGRYFEGRDMSASNVQSDTCEAGTFQTSWNIRSGNSVIPPMLSHFWGNPNGFLDVFKEGLSPSANNLNSYGSGDGIKYQFLSRFCPLFHCMVTGVGMRTLRQHWGPINRREVLLKREADVLLRDVQALVESVA